MDNHGGTTYMYLKSICTTFKSKQYKWFENFLFTKRELFSCLPQLQNKRFSAKLSWPMFAAPKIKSILLESVPLVIRN